MAKFVSLSLGASALAAHVFGSLTVVNLVASLSNSFSLLRHLSIVLGASTHASLFYLYVFTSTSFEKRSEVVVNQQRRTINLLTPII